MVRNVHGFSLEPQGAELIGTTIISRIFAPSYQKKTKQKMEGTLNTLALISPHNFGEDTHLDRSEPIMFVDTFIEFLLVPYVSIWLIGHEKDVRFSEAMDIKDASADFGDIHWNQTNPTLLVIEAVKK
jgi:hypothetical protein